MIWWIKPLKYTLWHFHVLFPIYTAQESCWKCQFLSRRVTCPLALTMDSVPCNGRRSTANPWIHRLEYSRQQLLSVSPQHAATFCSPGLINYMHLTHGSCMATTDNPMHASSHMHEEFDIYLCFCTYNKSQKNWWRHLNSKSPWNH